MPSVETMMIVTMAGLGLSASPGPSMLYVLSRSIGQSRNAGFVSAVGLATGGAILAVAVALGLSVVLTASPAVYSVIQYAGAAYLVYLGISMLREDGGDGGTVGQVRRESLTKIFLQGVFVEVLNPKTVMFFLAFLPQFVDVERGSVSVQMLILGIVVPLTAIPSDIIVALSGGTFAKKLSANRTMRAGLKWLGGLFLIGLGVRVLFV